MLEESRCPETLLQLRHQHVEVKVGVVHRLLLEEHQQQLRQVVQVFGPVQLACHKSRK